MLILIDVGAVALWLVLSCGAVPRSERSTSNELTPEDLPRRSGDLAVHGLSQHPLAQFPSLSASLDYARRECAAAPATIELVIDGFYAVVHQEDGWPRALVGFDVDHPRPVSRRAGARGHHRDGGSVARLRSSWFIKWRDAAIRSIAALAPGFMAMKRSKLDQTPI